VPLFSFEVDMADKYTINCDANKPSEDGFVAAYIVKHVNKLVHQLAEPITAETSCEAEYEALILAMNWCDSSDYLNCRFLTDSRFVVCGAVAPKKHNKALLAAQQTIVKAFLTKHPTWTVEWIPRAQNHAVDTLSRMNPAATVETFKQE
jgi:ribonuclease HI